MRRFHLFEFGDQPWFPQLVHDAETAYLAALYRFFPALTRQWAQTISGVLDPAAPAEIVDLASGSGGAMPFIIDELARRGYHAHATLTDLFPNSSSAAHPKIHWLAEPVDATHVPAKLTGVRTMFSAFHHLRPDAAQAVLKDAFDNRRPICIFESGPGGTLGVILSAASPIHVLFVMPFARPFRWGYLVFTYLVPLLSLILLWDSIVSNLRIYSPQQMQTLTANLTAPDYEWKAGRIKVRAIPGGAPYLVGRPAIGVQSCW